eukprot:6034913-Amphidinium_carterae.1
MGNGRRGALATRSYSNTRTPCACFHQVHQKHVVIPCMQPSVNWVHHLRCKESGKVRFMMRQEKTLKAQSMIGF